MWQQIVRLETPNPTSESTGSRDNLEHQKLIS
jgi:hypothetical protein